MFVTPAGWKVVPVSGKPGEEDEMTEAIRELFELLECNEPISGFGSTVSKMAMVPRNLARKIEEIFEKLGISPALQDNLSLILRRIALIFLIVQGYFGWTFDRTAAYFAEEIYKNAGQMAVAEILSPHIRKRMEKIMRNEDLRGWFTYAKINAAFIGIAVQLLTNPEIQEEQQIQRDARETGKDIKAASGGPRNLYNYFRGLEVKIPVVENVKTQEDAEEFWFFILNCSVLLLWQLLTIKCDRFIRPTQYLEEGQFNVERIVYEDSNSRPPKYLIKWQGYPENENTWATKESLDMNEEVFDELLRIYREGE